MNVFVKHSLFAGWFLAVMLTVGNAGTPADLKLARDWKVQVTVSEPRARAKAAQVVRPVIMTVIASGMDQDTWKTVRTCHHD